MARPTGTCGEENQGDATAEQVEALRYMRTDPPLTGAETDNWPSALCRLSSIASTSPLHGRSRSQMALDVETMRSVCRMYSLEGLPAVQNAYLDERPLGTCPVMFWCAGRTLASRPETNAAPRCQVSLS